MNILCVGDCGVDVYLPELERRPGGITLNVALAARRWFPATDRIHIAAPLGTDEAADIVRARLAGSGITTEFLLRTGATPIQEIEVDEAGERHFRGYHVGVLRDYRAADIDSGLLASADLLITPVFEQNRDSFLSVIRADTSATRAVDFADFAVHQDFAFLESVIDWVDVGFFALSPEQDEVIAQLGTMASAHRGTFVVTLGAHGSLAFDGAQVWRCEARPVSTVVDTTGAGDAFTAGFLARYLYGRDSQAALVSATNAACEALARKGGN